MLEQGDTAPNVTFATPDGDRSVAGYQGRKLVLYFYPKDDTSGCTREAIEFNAMRADFAAAGADVALRTVHGVGYALLAEEWAARG